jgi:hypothetical protein
MSSIGMAFKRQDFRPNFIPEAGRYPEGAFGGKRGFYNLNKKETISDN